MSEAPVLEAIDIVKELGSGAGKVRAVKGASLTLVPGELTLLMGPSGSGKTTLLSILGCILTPTSGVLRVAGTSTDRLDAEQLAHLRRQHMGFIFQSYNLFPTLTALENVRVPAEISGDFARAAGAARLLERMGLGARAGHYPAQLSGGEMQRVALARAAINGPAVLMADEPTGNLDAAAGAAVLALLLELQAEATLILVTHNAELAARAEREVCMRHGRIERILERGRASRVRA